MGKITISKLIVPYTFKVSNGGQNLCEEGELFLPEKDGRNNFIG